MTRHRMKHLGHLCRLYLLFPTVRLSPQADLVAAAAAAVGAAAAAAAEEASAASAAAVAAATQ